MPRSPSRSKARSSASTRRSTIKSTSGNDGSYSLTVSFELGTNPDINTVNVNNRVQRRDAAKLPRGRAAAGRDGQQEVGGAPAVSRLVFAEGTAYDALYLTNYATINLLDQLARTPGVGQAHAVRPAGLFAAALARSRPADRPRPDARPTSSRPSRARTCRRRVGRIGAAPVADDQQYQLNIKTKGRLTRAERVRAIIVLRTNPDGSVVRLRRCRAARARRRKPRRATAASTARPRAAIGIYQAPGANADRGRRRVRASDGGAAEALPGRRGLQASSTTPRCSCSADDRRGRRHAGRGLRPGRASSSSCSSASCGPPSSRCSPCRSVDRSAPSRSCW